MRILTYLVTPQDAGRALRSILPSRMHLGVHLYRRLKIQNGIFVNGEPAHANRILQTGDLLEVHLPDDTDAASPKDPSFMQEQHFDAPSQIRYMDDDLIIVSKGAPLATLPCMHLQTGTLREQLCQMLSKAPDSFSYHPVNRLDKGTSGLMVVARNAHVQRLMTAQLHTDSFIREYLAVTEGVPKEKSFTIDAPIARIGSGAARAVRPDGKNSVTMVRLIQTSGNRALVRLHLLTGRTHQIRVHLAHIGCPVCGDYLYGTELPSLGGRFALHSAFLSCRQPVTGKLIEREEPLPKTLMDLLDGSD